MQAKKNIILFRFDEDIPLNGNEKDGSGSFSKVVVEKKQTMGLGERETR